MINDLRRRFIRITMVSVTLVLLFLSLSVNGLYWLSVSRDTGETLALIAGNEGSMPEFGRPGGPGGEGRPGGFGDKGDHLSPEAPFSTRYFTLTLQSDGSLIAANLTHIAAVTGEDIGGFLAAVPAREGSGFVGQYRYLVRQGRGDTYTAVFLDCQRELRSMRIFALATLGMLLFSDGLVYLLVVLFSRRAIDPVVKSMEKQKQFITDASHELKTPLTVITTSLRVLEMEVGQQRWIDKAQNQVDHLRDLVNDLVQMARLDEEKPARPFAPFDASAAVQETAESFAEAAAEGGHPLTLQIAPALSLNGDEYALRQLVSILMDNALKYADPESPITLTLTRQRRFVVLTQENRCQGLTAEELPRLFDRFYRADKARTGQNGFGLGLSIVKGIAQQHHGTASAALSESDTVRFTVTLRG